MLTKKHIERALAELRIGGFDPKRQSVKWDLLDSVTGQRFPPKVVLWRAYELADDAARPGGGWPTNDVLEQFGYNVVPKPNMTFVDEEQELLSLPLDLLVRIAKRRTRERPVRSERTTSYVERSAAISALAKKLADGQCDLCGSPAPFSTKAGPYLECHHIKWLSQGGSDTIDNVVAICANCHRKMHLAAEPEEVRKLSGLAQTRAKGLA